jgi:hypothetical protein
VAGVGRGIATLAVVVAVLGSSSAVEAADADWARGALADQYELGSALPLRNTPWVGTHNSFNSAAEMGPALSAQDSNQRITLVDQLDAGVRSLELDVHWFPSASGGGFTPVVCHATGEHLGCTIEKPLSVVLDEIAGWLRQHPGQALLLYLEDHVDGAEGHDAAAAVVESKLGTMLYRPPGGGASCVPLPLDVTRSAIRASGAQVVIVSGCGSGTAWRAVAFDWSAVHEEEGPAGFRDFPDCGPHFTRVQYDTKLIRYFEDSTWVSNGPTHPPGTPAPDGITVQTAAAMARCGVDLTGMDQVDRDDPRFAALVWSWAPGEPALRPGCAAQAGGRWYSQPCTRRERVACRGAGGGWSVPRKAVRFADAAAACARAGAAFEVPRSGYEGQLLRVAMERDGAGRAWVSHRAG